jgi:hypothetical protein
VLFIAVMGFIYAGLFVVGGMFGLIAGASHHIAELVVFGLTSVIVGAVTIIGAALLVRYANYLGGPQADHGLGGTRSPSMAQSEAALPESVCKAGSDSRPWVLSIAVMGFIYAGLFVVGGMFGLIAGASQHIPERVFFGLTSVIVGAVTIIGAALLVRYANYLGGLRYARQFVVLERALEALKTFWIIESIVLIVVLAFIVMTVVWETAVGATLAGWVRP